MKSTRLERLWKRLDRRPAIAVLVLTIGYVMPAAYIAANAGLSADEIHALHVAQQPGFTAIWRALARGADNQPPLDYWLRHLSVSVVGSSSFGLRLPSLLAVWGTMVTIFTLVRRRLGSASGWSAALLMLLVSGFQTSFERGGYAVQLLCFALALQAWDCLVDRRSRANELVLLASLVAAVYAHYYSVLYLLGFAAAACAQSWAQRRVAWRSFLIVVSAGVLCAPLTPLVRSAQAYRTHFWAPPTGGFVDSFFPVMLWSVTPCLIFMAMLLALASAESRERDDDRRSAFSADTVFALVAFVALPAAMLPLALFVTGAFHPRYIVAGGVAVCLMAIALVERLSVGGARRAAALVVIPAVCFAVQAGRQVRGLAVRPIQPALVDALAAFQNRPEPVVISNREQFVELSYYDRSRMTNCYFVYDAFPNDLTYIDRAIAGLSLVMPLHAMTFAEMKTQHPSFVVVAADRDAIEPVVRRAVAEGAHVSLHRDDRSGVTYWRVQF